MLAQAVNTLNNKLLNGCPEHVYLGLPDLYFFFKMIQLDQFLLEHQVICLEILNTRLNGFQFFIKNSRLFFGFRQLGIKKLIGGRRNILLA